MFDLTISLMDGQKLTRNLEAGQYKLGSDSAADIIIFSQNMLDILCDIELSEAAIQLNSDHLDDATPLQHENIIECVIDGIEVKLMRQKEDALEIDKVSDKKKIKKQSSFQKFKDKNWRDRKNLPALIMLYLGLITFLFLLSFAFYKGIIWLGGSNKVDQVALKQQNNISYFLSKLSSYYELIYDDNITYIFVKDQKVKARIESYIAQKSLLNHQVILIDEVLNSAQIIAREVDANLNPHDLRAQTLNILGKSDFKHQTMLKNRILSAFPMIKKVEFNHEKISHTFDLKSQIAAIYYDDNPHVILKNKQKYHLNDRLPNGAVIKVIHKNYLQVKDHNGSKIIRGF